MTTSVKIEWVGPSGHTFMSGIERRLPGWVAIIDSMSDDIVLEEKIFKKLIEAFYNLELKLDDEAE